MNKYWWILFIALAGIFNACMDTVVHHYGDSVFTVANNPEYFDAAISWINKYSNVETLTRKQIFGVDVPVVFTDFWHLSKALMLCFISLSIVTYKKTFDKLSNVWSLAVDFIIARAAFGLVFTLFYSWVLIK